MNKFPIVKMASPTDPLGKSKRPAVILHEYLSEGEFWCLAAPCTSYTARKGTVPHGSVLVGVTSKAFPATKWEIETDIELNKMFRYRKFSAAANGVKATQGVLDLDADNGLFNRFATVMKENRELLAKPELLPVAF